MRVYVAAFLDCWTVPQITIVRARHCKDLNTLCAQRAQSRTRSSEITFLRTVLVWLSTCIPYQLNNLRKNAISDERIRDCTLYTHSVARP